MIMILITISCFEMICLLEFYFLGREVGALTALSRLDRFNSRERKSLYNAEK